MADFTKMRMNASDKLKVPEKLPDIMKEFAKAVINDQPKNLV
jgi:hypothetical protein